MRLGTDGPMLLTTLQDARAALVGAEDFVLPFDVSRRRIRRDEGPGKTIRPVAAARVAVGREVLAAELASAAAAFAGQDLDTLLFLRSPIARSTTAALLPEAGVEDRNRVGDLVLAWIDSLGPVISARRPPRPWSSVRRAEQRANRTLLDVLEGIPCESPAARATALAAGIQVPIAAGAWCLTQLAHRPGLRLRLVADAGLASAFVWETLRLYPPSWLLPRITTRHVQLGSASLPAYTPVVVSPLALGRLPEVAPGPESGFRALDDFDPDRWASPNSRPDSRPGGWLPFGAGAHACPGRNLGFAQLVSLVTWAAAYDLRLDRTPALDVRRGLCPNPAVIDVGLRIVAPVTQPEASRSPVAEAPRMAPSATGATALALSILSGEGTITAAVERAGALLASYPGVDLLAVSLTQVDPDGRPGWVHLGQRAWLREWGQPGTTSSAGPRQDSGPGEALSMPWVSRNARLGVVVVSDAELLPADAQQDRRELAMCGVRALVTSSMVVDGVMMGSVAMTRESAGEWPESHVADLRLLSAALGSRMAAVRAQGALADAIQRGDLARASQQAFFSAIGHELRTPLAAIVGTSEMLGSDARELVETAEEASGVSFAASVAHDAEVILSAGEQLLGIVENLLSTGQELGGGTESQWVGVAEAVSDVIHWMRTSAVAADVTVSADVPAETSVLTTNSGLRQILTNLLGNAIAYNRPGGSVEVTTSRTHDEFGEPRVRVSVHDTGPGLTPEQQEEVFKPFVRFAGPEVRGTGLGLSLSRSLAERDGGMMGLESTPGEGSVFWVDLPAAPTAVH